MEVISCWFETREFDPCSAECGTSERRDASLMMRMVQLAIDDSKRMGLRGAKRYANGSLV